MFQLRNSLNLSACAVATAVLLSACGGGDGAKVSKIDGGFSIEGGIAQKGPMAARSNVAIDELLTSSFASSGTSYHLQTTGDLGEFDTSALKFKLQYIKTYVSGYYRNENTGQLADDQVTLMGYSDLNADRLVNVNLLTTLAGPRIEKLVQDKTNTSYYGKFAAARTQAQKEVLAAFRIYNAADLLPGGTDSSKNIVAGNFNEIDLSKTQTSSQILAALSAVAVTAGVNGAGISEFIADFQADLTSDGLISTTAVRNQIDAASDTTNMTLVATNLKSFFPSTTVTAALLSPWVDSSGGTDQMIDKYKSTATGTANKETQSVSYAVGADDVGQCFSASAGNLYKGTAKVTTGTVKAAAGDKFKIGLNGSDTQTSGFIQRSAPSTAGACPTAVPSSGLTRVAKYTRTNDLKAQATLVAAATSSSVSTSGTTILSTTGGSGNGDVTFAVASGACTISGTTLTAPSSAGTCTVTATKAATSVYAAATSAPITITVNTAVAATSLVFSSGYTNTDVDTVNYSRAGKSVELGSFNWYQSSGVGESDWSNFWWNGISPLSDSVPSFYFGLGFASSTGVPYIGAYVNAPQDGSVTLSGQTKLKIALWGNDELTSRKVPTFTVMVQLKDAYSGCYVEAAAPVITPSAIGAQIYTLTLSNFTIQNNCANSGVTTIADFFKKPIGSVHTRVLKANMFFNGSAVSPNGINMGAVSFEP